MKYLLVMVLVVVVGFGVVWVITRPGLEQARANQQMALALQEQAAVAEQAVAVTGRTVETAGQAIAIAGQAVRGLLCLSMGLVFVQLVLILSQVWERKSRNRHPRHRSPGPPPPKNRENTIMKAPPLLQPGARPAPGTHAGSQQSVQQSVASRAIMDGPDFPFARDGLRRAA